MPWDSAAAHGDRAESVGARSGRRDRRQAKLRHRAHARELRWQANRLAVPYRTDGPKLTFGLLWCAAVVVAATNSTFLLAALVASAAGLAGLQAGNAWFEHEVQAKWWTALAAFVSALGGALGGVGVFAGLGLAAAILLVYVMANPDSGRTTPQLLDVLVRSSLPFGFAAASIPAVREVEVGAVLALVALVSAYEAGDFLVGSGSANAVEGPLSGFVAVAVVAFIIWTLTPEPFTAKSVIVFGAIAGLSGPVGQILASALLPRGSVWAPAVRRLDSYLVAAPLWLGLLLIAPASASL